MVMPGELPPIGLDEKIAHAQGPGIIHVAAPRASVGKITIVDASNVRAKCLKELERGRQ